MPRRPHVIFVFADEWRAQAAGHAGDPNCDTPAIDAFAGESVDVSLAVSGCPVCCPYRASLMTGQYPLTHGVFINDVELDPGCRSLAQVFGAGGWRTAYVGKWHLYGSPDGRYGRRSAPVPRSHQLGFDDWWGFECTHDYWQSPWYHNDDPARHLWEGYDLFAQTDHAAAYIREHAHDADPFLLMLSWGPPHFPLQTAPERYRARYAEREIRLRPNVPAPRRDRAVNDLRGYYAHIAAMDDGFARLLAAIDAAGIAEETIVVLTSDHGEMAQSQGLDTKLHPFDESLRVPFLLRWPARFGRTRREVPLPLDAPDLLPTLAGLCGLPVPAAVQGTDHSPVIRGEQPVAADAAALLQMPVPFTELRTYGFGAYRGLRTRTHTYARNAAGPWLLFDNAADPYQMRNLVADPASAALRADLDARLDARLRAVGDPEEDPATILARAGLDHYREVQNPCRERWTDPWRS
jgi:arylsulfatase A-like enzyme